MSSIKQSLTELFKAHFNEIPESIEKLPLSGSNRRYYRITSQQRSIIGTYNPDQAENEAFIYLTRHFLKKQLPVPALFATQDDIYLQEDLGNETLYNYIGQLKKDPNFTEKATVLYKQIIDDLIRFQVEGHDQLDYNHCYPRKKFDRQSILWDLHYFKYHFLKLAYIPFHEGALEKDFQKLADFLETAPDDYFLFRDFQSRNIMITPKGPKYIDYQGGRQGALQYDLAALLYEAKIDLPEVIRQEILSYYVRQIHEKTNVSSDEFLYYYPAFALIRILQAFGAYGYRGLIEQKPLFIKSIPFALKNLESILKKWDIPTETNHLFTCLSQMLTSTNLKNLIKRHTMLNIQINSFSYKRGIPYDNTGHGGGHVFDCRSLPNPGRSAYYKALTGKDKEVIQFFKNNDHDSIDQFMHNVKGIIDQTIDNYLRRSFKHLSIGFGCTGGQHRSVYCAEMLYAYLKQHPQLEVSIKHHELEKLTLT